MNEVLNASHVLHDLTGTALETGMEVSCLLNGTLQSKVNAKSQSFASDGPCPRCHVIFIEDIANILQAICSLDLQQF